MKIGKMLYKTERFISNNSPLILTGVGVVGSIATALMAGKASFEAAEKIGDANDQRKFEATTDPDDPGGDDWEPLNRKEQFKLVWVTYLPTVGVGLVTVASIIGANQINAKRAAAIAAAYMAGEKAHEEYKDKVAEMLGVKKEEEIRASVDQNQIDRDPFDPTNVFYTGNGDVLFRDGFSGRYFFSDMESVRKSENDINKQVLAYDSATLTNFYTNLGLAPTSHSDDFGWDSSDGNFLEIKYSTGTTDDDRLPCHTIKYKLVPMRDFRGWGDI